MSGKRYFGTIGVTVLVILSVLGFALNSSAKMPPQKERLVKQALKRIEIPFIKNEGQVDKEVAFYAKTFGGGVFVTKKGELVYALSQGGKDSKKAVALKERLLSAQVKRVVGEEPSTTKVNYFIQRDRSRWRKNIATYEGVSLGEVYQGITLGLRATGDNVEKIFRIKPGADQGLIRIKLEGARTLKIGKKGELIAETQLGEVRFSKPLGYQGREETKEYVKISYVKLSKNEYGFRAGKYDKKKELVIDPLLASTFIEGSGYDYISALAMDSAGNVYVAGNTPHPGYPTTPGAYDTSYIGEYIIPFISKLNSKLTALLASTFIGGSSDDIANALAIDSSGNVYVAGITNSSDYPTTPGAYDTSYNGSGKGFISKLNSNLTTLLASTFIGGSGNYSAPVQAIDESVSALAIDSAGNVYVAGSTGSSDYPTTPGAYDTSYDDEYNNEYDQYPDAVISKFNSSLTTLLASTFIGGSYGDYAYALAIDSSGNVYVAGITSSGDYPTTPGAYDRSDHGAFISKLNSNLTTLLASTRIGGSLSDYAYALAIDSSGNVYVRGYTHSPDYPTTPGAYNTSYNGSGKGFISKLNSNLMTLLASTYIGGSGADYPPYALAIDASGNVYVTGDTKSSDYPTTPGAYDTSYNGGGDGFISKFNSNLTTLLTSTFIGGSGGDHISALAIDTSGNVCVAGYTQSSDYPTTPGAYDTNGRQFFTNNSQLFISKIGNIPLSPSPVIRVNGQRGDVLVDSNTTNISLSCQMNSNGIHSDADWWLVRVSPDGTVSHFRLLNNVPAFFRPLFSPWQSGLSTTYEGQLVDFPDTPIINIPASSMSLGRYTFVFAVDTNMNGQVDSDQLVYDYVTVEVREIPSGTGALVVGRNSICIDNVSYEDVEYHIFPDAVPFFDEEHNAYYGGCNCMGIDIDAFFPGKTCQEVCIDSAGKFEGSDGREECTNSIAYDLASKCPPCPPGEGY
jgi:hypothetical protein